MVAAWRDIWSDSDDIAAHALEFMRREFADAVRCEALGVSTRSVDAPIDGSKQESRPLHEIERAPPTAPRRRRSAISEAARGVRGSRRDQLSRSRP